MVPVRAALRSKFSRPTTNRRTPSAEGEVLKWTVNVEAIRVFAYINFFIMILCAIIVNKVANTPRLKAGPADGSTCGPFDGAMGDSVDPPVKPGEGFDVATQSHLTRAFGYNNVCANWDYSPSREITAMVYPIFEYSLLLYLFFDFIQAYVYFKKGWCSRFYFRTFQVMIVLMLMGCAWFRMIFVVIAYQDLAGHTAGFFCLQLTLIMVATMNTWFVIDTKASFSWLGGQKGTQAVALLYLVCNLIICPIKLYLTGEIVFNSKPASWSLNMVGNQYAGQLVDNIWFVFNAVIPLFVGLIRACCEDALMIEINLPTPTWIGEDQADAVGDEEGIALKEVADGENEEVIVDTGVHIITEE